MRSLRARLVAGLVALAAVGLVALAGITYAEQRSFQLERIDQQVHDASLPLARLLAERGIGTAPGPRGGGPPPPDFPLGPGLQPGAFGERRAADGRVLGSVAVPEADGTVARPRLPDAADLPLGAPVTVDAAGGGGTRFRAVATPDPDRSGGTLVAALPLTAVEETLDRLLLVEALVIAGVLLALGAGAWLLVRVGLLPLDRIAHTADRIAGGDLARRVEATDPRTEVGRLGVAFNAMLDRLEEAFAQRQASEERLRRFLADASHELRTPLSSIRGYAELFRIGAARSPADTAKAMRRIEQEATRMGVLVEDLLVLARLDELREAEHGPVDVAQLARDAVDDARATSTAHPIALDAPAAAVVDGNAHQLRQVLGNLLRNAVVHTPSGTPIAVAVRRDARGVRLEVRDGGPGLPTERPEELFERFWRAERGRERGRGGAGLGLAIVAGIVAAHGGTVAAANAPDGGAVFTVALPARP